MDNSKYIDIIKKTIESKVKEHSINGDPSHDFFKTLLPKISDSISLIAGIWGLPTIDNTTLTDYFDIAVKEYQSVHPVDINPSNSLTKKGFRSWLTAERKIDWNYSNRYFSLLQESGRSEKVMEETKKSSLAILEKLGDPKSKDPFFVKGLVVGSVQSGKTSNFNAVINRSIDAGYGLILVLSGIMEDLRQQTQLRIENEVIGTGVVDLEKGTKGTKGVGKIRRFGNLGDVSVDQVASVTSYKSDFTKALADANFSLDATNVFVCKKNVSVLKNLIVWLHDFLEEYKDKHNIPLLLLDDEADNASLNNLGKKGKEYASVINGHIRALLELFQRKTYLGYTATPFANVLQDKNKAPETDWAVKYKLNGNSEEKTLPRVPNLFPDDFITLLNPPSNYVGAKQLFETVAPIENAAGTKIPLIEIVNDYIDDFPDRVYEKDGNVIGVENFKTAEEWDEKVGASNSYMDFPTYREYKQKTRSARLSDDFPKKLPSSLKESIRCFIISIAIREYRKPLMIFSALYTAHHSMLIHISRFTQWQNKLKDLTLVYIKDLQTRIALENPKDPSSVYAEFEKTWYKCYAKIIEHIKDFLPKDYIDEFLSPVTFKVIRNYLPESIRDVEVKAINSFTRDKLEYPKNSPKKVIAIGGNRLSRGFTLEGLTINYFIRTTNYSDTLLQMGRWFGYRPGYLDCCKLFTNYDSMEKFDITTRTIEELEGEFRKMEAQDKTPDNFRIRVRKHPGTLKITRPSILKNTTEVKWSYQDQLEQTTKFRVENEKLQKVWSAFRYITSYFKFNNKLKGFLTCRTDVPGIIRILSLENNFDRDTCNGMIKFIELCLKNNKLTNWTIAVKTEGDASTLYGKGSLTKAESGLPEDITLTVRRGPKNNNGITNPYRKEFLEDKIFRASGKSANIISGGKDFSLLLTEEQIKDAEAEFRIERRNYYIKDKSLSESDATAKANALNIPERVYREKMSEQDGLLIIYLLDPYYVFLQEKGNEDTKFREFVEKEKIDLNMPLVGYAIGFPPIEDDPGGIYVQGDYENFGEEDMDEEIEEYNELPDDVNDL